MVESSSPTIPIYLNSFLLFFVAGWVVRTIVLPYKIARRVGRKFKYGDIGPKDVVSLTKGERALMMAQKILAIAGLLAFLTCGFLLFRLAGQPLS